MDWYEKACERIEADYAAGDIDFGEYHNQMRDLTEELQQAAQDAAEDAYANYIG